jgi:hypothetical protein
VLHSVSCGFDCIPRNIYQGASLISFVHVIAQGARRWLLPAETQVQSQVTLSEIRGGRSGTAAISPIASVPLLITIPPLVHTYLSPPHEVHDSPDQAAHYHTLGPKLVASSLTRHLAGLGVKIV